MAVEYDPLDYDNIGKSVVRALLGKDPEALSQDLRFDGAGIYALYYTGDFPLYRPIARPPLQVPIYIGKAIYGGRRKGWVSALQSGVRQPLAKRLCEHAWSINQAENLALEDFLFKLLVVKQVWISLAERILIERFRPVWNAVIDGFGNHAPGSGRTSMRCPKWDTMHPGRPWAAELRQEYSRDQIAREIKEHLDNQRKVWEESPPWEL